MSKTYCGDCGHFLGMGDFDLCCEIHHPTPACDEYVPKEEKEQ